MKINIKDEKKIQEKLAKVETGCTARVFDMGRIEQAIKQAENCLESLKIPKKYWVGCRIDIFPAALPNSYKSRGEGTEVDLERTSTGWFVVYASRVGCRTVPYGDAGIEKLTLSEIAKNAIPNEYQL